MEAEKRKDRHDDDDKTDEVNYSVHGKSPGRVGEASFSPLTRTAVPPFRTSFHLDGRVGKQTLCCTAPPLISLCTKRLFLDACQFAQLTRAAVPITLCGNAVCASQLIPVCPRPKTK
jgi:hypothetical protein